MRIEFDLLRNALDSIAQAMELVAWDDELNEARRLKRAMLTVGHGVELLLKEWLRRIHPAFIWGNIENFLKIECPTLADADGSDIPFRRLLLIRHSIF